MHIITAANSKGGAGKSLMLIGLASALHHHGKRVLGIDLDPQATFSGWWKNGETVPETDLKIIPGRFDSRSPEENAKNSYELIDQYVNADEYDVLLIDTKGEASVAATMAMCGSDTVLVPTNGTGPEFEPIVATYRSLASALKKTNSSRDPQDIFRVVFTRLDYFQAATIKENLDILSSQFKCIEGIYTSSAYNDAYTEQLTLHQLLVRAQEIAATEEKPALKTKAAKAAERYQKALGQCSLVLENLGLIERK